MQTVHHDDADRQPYMLDLDEIARQGARRMLAEALEAEVEAYIEAARDQRDQNGHALVVRNGRAREREVLLEPGLWRFGLRESMIVGWTTTVRSAGSRA
jgi:hypothetical protein